MSKKPTDKGHARDAKSGEYVTKKWAERHPSTTVVEKTTKPGGSKPIVKGHPKKK